MEIFNFLSTKNTKSGHRNQNNIKNELQGMKRSDKRDIVHVKKTIKHMKPNEAGLYPHEILLLSYAPTYYLGKNSFPKFWWYKYGIKDVDKWLKSLKKRGFLKTGSIESTIRNETTDDLKEVLSANKLKVTGSKAELVKRLLEEVPEEKLNNLFRDRTYELTELGEEVLSAEEHIPYIHRLNIVDLDIWSLNEKVKENPRYYFKDIIWENMNKKSLKYYKHSDFVMYRNCRLSMAEFLEDEGKDDTALMYLAEVVRLDLSGLFDGFSMGDLEDYADSYFPYGKSTATIASGVTEKINKYQEEKDMSDDELKDMLIELMNHLQLPFSLFTVEESADIVIMEIHGEREELKEIYQLIKERFEKEYRFYGG